MNIIHVLARCARRVWPFSGKPKVLSDTQSDKQRAHASLHTRLPPHLLKDVGADDG